jgi:hypothetical protein
VSYFQLCGRKWADDWRRDKGFFPEHSTNLKTQHSVKVEEDSSLDRLAEGGQ